MEYNNKIPGKPGQKTEQGYTHERDRWEPEPFINRPRWSAMKIVVVTLILLALCYGVNYLMKEMSGPAAKAPAEEVVQPSASPEDATTEEDLSIDWDNAPQVLDEEEPVDELMDEPVDEELDNTEEDLALPIYEEVE